MRLGYHYVVCEISLSEWHRLLEGRDKRITINCGIKEIGNSVVAYNPWDMAVTCYITPECGLNES